MPVQVDLSKLQKAIGAWSGAVSIDAAKEMRIQARVLAMRLMQNTQPSPVIGSSPKNNNMLLEQSKKKIRRQVSSVYTSPALASFFISKIKLPRGKTETQNPEQAARAFSALMRGRVSQKTGRASRPTKSAVVQAQDILNRFNRHPFMNTQIDQFDAGQAHRKARFGPRQNVPRNQALRLVVTNQQAIDAYIKKRQENIGVAKAGWAACADELGGAKTVRSKDDGRVELPGWVRRQLKKFQLGSVSDNSDRKKDPFIELRNGVKYIGQLISQETVQQTIDTQVLRMINRLGIISSAQARKAGL